MSRYDFYGYFKPTKPHKVEDGIKARSKRGAFATSWWATRWIAALERLTDRGRLTRGRRYARAGQVVSLDEKNGAITAKVQGSSRKPYTVRISVDDLSRKQWNKVFDSLADQAIFSAQLLAGEMPDEIETVFSAAGVSLFPERSAELHTDCSCPDWSNPCKHVAAVHYILGEQFDEDPFLLFRLRGCSRDDLLAALRARRAGEADPDIDETPEPLTLPLPDDLSLFWGEAITGPAQISVKAPVVPLSALKRLGDPKFTAINLTAQLGPAYQAITTSALAAADEV